MKQDIKSMNQTEIKQVLAELGEPAFRAKQIFVWLHKGCRRFGEMFLKICGRNLMIVFTSRLRLWFVNSSLKRTARSNICGDWKTETAWNRF